MYVYIYMYDLSLSRSLYIYIHIYSHSHLLRTQRRERPPRVVGRPPQLGSLALSRGARLRLQLLKIRTRKQSGIPGYTVYIYTYIYVCISIYIYICIY